ncbi:hypothetical protein BCR33DRAFT_717329 [Rhizoclosmatium globosum]|uniref:Glycosyltransferase 2-like domain-containing protein n=1 Tax=Rhizoclosmatium globosum TaxID=329046 RepID=A0A1Y2C9C7_9FUNG|nr:hypothetical protein BCR33DRAFT_717329 [Rhizoclosmatium globosum]|eukprot:ORY43642.1 hypothetical protein BCR33DRAFT_717329 [Rhizoclosmatium globosum]
MQLRRLATPALFAAAILCILWLAIEAAPNRRVVVSLTTFPGRVVRIEAALRSLSAQSLKVDRIVLSLPNDVLRFDRKLTLSNEEEKLLETLQRDIPQLLIHKTTDYGSATKLLGALELEHDDDTIIVTVDDDTEYHKHTVHALVQALEDQTLQLSKNPSAPIGPTCFVCQKKLWYWPIGIHRQRHSGPCNGFLNAFAGVAYKVSFFTKTEGALKHVFDHSSWEGVPVKGCRLHDDVWLSGVLYKTSNGRIRPQVVIPGFSPILNHLPYNEFSINQVKKGESEYRDPCLKFFNWLE